MTKTDNSPRKKPARLLLLALTLILLPSIFHQLSMTTSTNLRKLLNGQEDIMVFFSGEPCKNCDKYRKELQSAEQSGSTKMFEIDCQLEISFCREYKIRSSPQSIYFFEGGRYFFNLFYTSKEIKEFLKKTNTKNAVQFNLKDFDVALERAVKSAEAISVFVGQKNSTEFKVYLQMLRHYPKDRFYFFEGALEELSKSIKEKLQGSSKSHLLVKAIAEDFSNSPNLLILKNELPNYYRIVSGETTQKTLADFYYMIKHPFLVTNQHEAMKLYKEMSPMFVMIVDLKDSDIKNITDQFSIKANEQKNNANFALLTVSETRKDYVDELIEQFEVEEITPGLPLLGYFQPDFETLKYKKYLFEGQLSLPRMNDFIKDCIAGDRLPIVRVNSRDTYWFADYPVLNASNWKATLKDSFTDVVILLFQDPSKRDPAVEEHNLLPKDLKTFLAALKDAETDANLQIYLFNMSKNDITAFIPDEKKDALMLFLKDSDPDQAQVFQKDDMAKKEITELINRRSEFDKRNQEKMMGGMGGMGDIENMDFGAIFEKLKDLDLGDLGGEGFDFGEGMEALKNLKDMDFGNMAGGFGGDL